MTGQHKRKPEYWKRVVPRVALQTIAVHRMVTAPTFAEKTPDWVIAVLVDQMGVDASALLVVGLATAAGVIRGRNVPAQVASTLREAWAVTTRPRGGRHRS